MIDHEQCWQAVQRRDGRFDGEFYFGVMTTGVYCRPSCGARRALRKNIRFYLTPAEAERDGLRPCMRCRPLDPARDLAAAEAREGCEAVEAGANPPAPRSFKRVMGLTPNEYAEAIRGRRLKGALRESPDVTAAIYDAGFGSPTRVYQRAAVYGAGFASPGRVQEHPDPRLATPPLHRRRGGQDVAITYAAADSPVG